MNETPLVVTDPWAQLRRLTSARIALGRAGSSLPTAPLLEFQLAHARARDAVHLPFDAAAVERQLLEGGQAVLQVHSQARERSVYLRRPDLGRRLDAASRALLVETPRRRRIRLCGHNAPGRFCRATVL